MSDTLVKQIIFAMFRDSVTYHLFEKNYDGDPYLLVQLHHAFRSMLNEESQRLWDKYLKGDKT